MIAQKADKYEAERLERKIFISTHLVNHRAIGALSWPHEAELEW